MYRKLAIEHLEKCEVDPAIRELIRPKKDVAAYNEIARAISQMRQSFSPVKPQMSAPKGKFDETEVLVLSDLHFGKRVVLEGEVVFDKDIAAERFKAIMASMRHLNASYVLPNHSINELVILLLGDIVDGETIYAGQVYNSDMPLIDQLTFAVQLIKKELIDPASQMFGSVRVVAVAGNHGEIRNDRGEHMMHPKTNFDSILAIMLQMGCQNLKNVSFEIATTTLHTTMIRNWKFLLAHKLPSASQSGFRKTYGGMFERFRYDVSVHGHWHTPELTFYNTKPIIQNGSLPGVDDYSIQLAFNTVPAQLLFTCSDKRPVALFWMVDVGHRTKEAELRSALE
jgi:predicted phosphodiesterase